MRPLRADRLASATRPVTGAGGRVVVPRCHVADRLAARTAGLLFTPDLAPDEGLWLAPCGSVHTIGLRAVIGCAFLDGEGRVLRVADPLPRWRAAAARGARVVLEAPAGALAGVAVGDVLRLA